jgi:hypothetical protein
MRQNGAGAVRGFTNRSKCATNNIMSRYTMYRNVCRFIAALAVAIPLTGCIKGLFEGEHWLWRPENSAHQDPTGSPNPTVGDNAPEKGKGGEPQTEKAASPQTPPATEHPIPISPTVKTESPAEAHIGEVDTAGRLAAAIVPGLSYHDAVLTEDVAWRGEVLIEGVVTVAPQATLTIEPGTVVRFGGRGDSTGRDAFLLVYGRVAAKGAPDNPILFSSRFAKPMAGDWQGITLQGSEKKNLFEYCRIEGAETGLDTSYSTVTLKNVLFSRCGTGARMRDTLVVASGGGSSGCITGMQFLDSEVEVSEPEIAGNRQGLLAERSSLYLVGGTFVRNDLEALKTSESRVKITGGSFTANGSGFTLVSSHGSVSGARIYGNAGYGILLSGSRVKVFGNEIARNGGAGLMVEDGRGVAWRNSLVDNGEYDLVNSGAEEFKAMGNWWGNSDLSVIEKRIFDSRSETGRGRVYVSPLLSAPPRISP